MKKRIITTILFMTTAICGLQASPFGIEMGWTVGDVRAHVAEISSMRIGEDQNYYKLVIEPIAQHPDLSFYMVFVDVIDGVFGIFASGDFRTTSGQGTELMERYEHIKEQLTSVYGNPIERSFLKEDSTLTKPEDWMKSLFVGERACKDFWFLKGNENEIEQIILEASAEESGLKGYVRLQYWSEKIDEVTDRFNVGPARLL
jgi:hypothetical protein